MQFDVGVDAAGGDIGQAERAGAADAHATAPWFITSVIELPEPLARPARRPAALDDAAGEVGGGGGVDRPAR